MDIDYVGTRLHGKIRVLNREKRAIILAVDNRAIEIANDTALPVVRREDIQKSWILKLMKQKIQILFCRKKIFGDGKISLNKSEEIYYV